MNKGLHGITVFLLFLASCGGGEKTVCDQAFEVRTAIIKEMCEYAEGRDDCDYLCPCLCLEKGRELEFVLDEQGLPDLSLTACMQKEKCEDLALAEAEDCLENEAVCREAGAFGFDEEFNWMGVPFCGPGSPLPGPVTDCPGL
jgi:hypothetical protein